MDIPSDFGGLWIIAVGDGFGVTRQELADMPQRSTLRRPSECSGNAAARPRTFEGVVLADLLDVHVGLDALAPETVRNLAVIAAGEDGYRCTLSWGEVFNSGAREHCLVALSCEGLPLDAAVGPLALVMAHDRNTGPRFIKRLKTIELRSL